MINPYSSVWDMGLGTWDMIFQLKKPFILSPIPFPLSQRELISVYYINIAINLENMGKKVENSILGIQLLTKSPCQFL